MGQKPKKEKTMFKTILLRPPDDPGHSEEIAHAGRDTSLQEPITEALEAHLGEECKR
jgi:hypothetical protein